MLEGDVDAVDRVILLAVAKTRSLWLTIAAVDLTALGSIILVVLFSAAALVILVVLHDRMSALQLLLASAGAGSWSLLTKNLIERDRPTEVSHWIDVSGYSYPSGHSLASAALYLTIAIIAARHAQQSSTRIVIVATALVILLRVGLSRVYLGVHYPSDVASGVSLGAALALFLTACFAFLAISSSKWALRS